MPIQALKGIGTRVFGMPARDRISLKTLLYFEYCLICFRKRERIGIINFYGCSGYFMNFPSDPRDPPRCLGDKTTLNLL